jgi:hypothetical protein
MNPLYVYFIIFACLGYLIVTDASVAKLVVFISRLAKFQYEKVKWWVWHNPKTPWASYIIWRRSMKIAKELEKEFSNK